MLANNDCRSISWTFCQKNLWGLYHFALFIQHFCTPDYHFMIQLYIINIYCSALIVNQDHIKDPTTLQVITSKKCTVQFITSSFKKGLATRNGTIWYSRILSFGLCPWLIFQPFKTGEVLIISFLKNVYICNSNWSWERCRTSTSKAYKIPPIW